MQLISHKYLRFFLCIMFPIILLVDPCLATTLLTEKEAIKAMFPAENEVVVEKKTPTDAQMERVKKRLGGRLVENQKLSKASEITHTKDIDFYFGVKAGEKEAVAIILEEPGMWGPIKFIIMLDLEGKVKDLEVMSYEETRGRPIVRESFLRQFVGKTSKEDFIKQVDAISGATISSRAAAFTVKKAIILYEELFLAK